MMDSRLAPIERTTIRLIPRTAAGCCDMAVMYYGRFAWPLLRLYAGTAICAFCLAYGLARFVGAGVAMVLAILILFSKPLGVLTIAAAWRTTFAEPFDWHRPLWGSPTTRTERLRRLSESLLTAGAALALLALLIAAIEDEYAAGRLVRLGRGAALTFVLVTTVMVAVRVAYFQRIFHRPSRTLRRALAWGMLLRIALAAPFVIFWWWEFEVGAALLIFCWLPVCAMIAGARSFRVESSALADIDPNLLPAGARRRQQSISSAGPGVAVSLAGIILISILVLGCAFFLRTLFGAGFLDPVLESLASGFAGFGSAVERIGSSGAFAGATVVIGLFAYQLARLAWFFVFLDSRIRYDCWDLELRLAQEARRLEAS